MIKVLYIEDEPFLAKIVKETLESKGYQILHIEDGAKVENAVTKEDFDICLLDIMLPNKSGFELAPALKKLRPNLPILFLTAKDQTEDVVMGLKLGARDYIKKPFSLEELILRMENILTHLPKEIKESDAIAIGKSIKFYPQKYCLIINNEKTQLSHKESIILRLLCEHMNKVLERKSILIAAWDDDSYYNSRNLDVYIAKLRSYLKADPEIEIKTLKGVGYQFVV